MMWLWENATVKFLAVHQGDRGGCVEEDWSGVIRKIFDLDFIGIFKFGLEGTLVVYLWIWGVIVFRINLFSISFFILMLIFTWASITCWCWKCWLVDITFSHPPQKQRYRPSCRTHVRSEDVILQWPVECCCPEHVENVFLFLLTSQSGAVWASLSFPALSTSDLIPNCHVVVFPNLLTNLTQIPLHF